MDNQDLLLQVLPFSTLNETVCRCPPASGKFFASSFVTPNLIDFHTVFTKFDASNAAVYGTMIGILILFIVGIVYFRRKDKTDVFKVMNKTNLNSLVNKVLDLTMQLPRKVQHLFS